MTARPSGCDCFDCSGEGASWRLLAISGVGHQAPGRQAGRQGRARVIIIGGAIVHCAPRDWSWLCHLYNELHFWPERESWNTTRLNSKRFSHSFLSFTPWIVTKLANIYCRECFDSAYGGKGWDPTICSRRKGPPKSYLNCEIFCSLSVPLERLWKVTKTPEMY